MSSGLPAVQVWEASAARRADLFAPLEPGARIGLALRESPREVLLWEAGERGITAKVAPFAGYDQPGVDVLLSADEAAVAAIRQAVERGGVAARPNEGDGAVARPAGRAAPGSDLFAVMRRQIREGALLFFMIRPGSELEALGYEELLEALGFACTGTCG